jgi:hypothetical protein
MRRDYVAMLSPLCISGNTFIFHYIFASPSVSCGHPIERATPARWEAYVKVLHKHSGFLRGTDEALGPSTGCFLPEEPVRGPGCGAFPPSVVLLHTVILVVLSVVDSYLCHKFIKGIVFAQLSEPAVCPLTCT